MNGDRTHMESRWAGNFRLTLPPKDAKPIGQNSNGDWIYLMEEPGICHFYRIMPGYLDTWDGQKDQCPDRFLVP